MENVDIQDIIVDNKYLRFDTDVTKLQKSIETLGLIAPLIINNEKHLIAGGRRYQALKNLNITTAPVLIVEKSELEEELISIDENLVRLDLSKIQLESNLRRAKELYQEMANSDESLSKELITKEELIKEKISEEKKLQEELNTKDNASDVMENAIEKLASQKFLIDVSEKTGMSPRQVWQAIERDKKSSSAVKDARSTGSLNLGQTNELIKLKSEDQELILPYIKDKTVKEIRNIVTEVRKKGIEEGIEMGKSELPHAREIKLLKTTLKKLHKITAQLQLEGITLSGKEEVEIHKSYEQVKNSLEDILQIDSYIPFENSTLHNNEGLERSF